MLETQAQCLLENPMQDGFQLTKMQVRIQGQVPGIDTAQFHRIAAEVETICPLWNALRKTMDIQLKVALEA